MTIFMLLAWRKCSQSQGLSLKSFWGRGRTGLALSLEVPEWVYQRPECVWPRPRWALTWQRERLGRFNLQKGAVTLRDSEQYQGSPEWPDWYLPSQSLARWVSKLEHRSEGAPDLGAALRRAGRVIAALPRRTRGSKLLLFSSLDPKVEDASTTGARPLPPFPRTGGGVDACARSLPWRERGPGCGAADCACAAPPPPRPFPLLRPVTPRTAARGSGGGCGLRAWLL